MSGASSTSVWVKSRRTRGQTRIGPLISCFMYDVWHVFEYLHVSEGDANISGKNWEEVQRTELPLSTETLGKQLSMMQFHF